MSKGWWYVVHPRKVATVRSNYEFQGSYEWYCEDLVPSRSAASARARWRAFGGSLGELYSLFGDAKEHAQQVLEVENPYAVDVAFGCPLGCLYCAGPVATRRGRETWRMVNYPGAEPSELVEKQLNNGLEPEGVLISFLTDPFLPSVRRSTEKLIQLLVGKGIKVATMSKLNVSSIHGVRNGMSIVSLDEEFWKLYERGATSPKERVKILKQCHKRGEYTWVNMEPYPCSAIWNQDVGDILEELKFVDFIMFGKWAFDRRCCTDEARKNYSEITHELQNFCKKHGIRHYVKLGTSRFIRGARIYCESLTNFRAHGGAL